MADKVYQIWLGLGFSIVTIVLLGLDMAFNVYALPLKKTFNFTQTEVELVSVSGLAGMGASLAEPYINQKFGFKIGYFLIWVTTSGSVLLMWVAILNREIFKCLPYVICMIQFLMNASQSAGFMRLISISVYNLPQKHVGKIVGLGHSAVAAAKLFYGAMLQMFFSDDLSHFTLFVAILNAVFVGICSFVHVPQSHVTDFDVAVNDSNRNLLIQESSDSSKAFSKSRKMSSVSVHETASHFNDDVLQHSHDKRPLNSRKISYDSRKIGATSDRIPNGSQEENLVGTMLKSAGFHVIFWPSVTIYSVMFTYMNNITSIAYSVGAHQPMNTVYVLSVTVVVGRLLSGFLFDKFHSSCCVFLLLLTSSVSVIVGITLLAVTTDYNVVLCLVSFFLGIGVSVGITIPVSVLTVRFGTNSVPYIIGSYYCFIAFFCLLFQFSVGILYDKTLSSDGFCHGSNCFFISSLILLALTILCTCVYIISFVIRLGKQCHMEI